MTPNVQAVLISWILPTWEKEWNPNFKIQDAGEKSVQQHMLDMHTKTYVPDLSGNNIYISKTQAHLYNPHSGAQNHLDLWVEASLVYRATFRTASTTQINLALKNRNENKQTKKNQPNKLHWTAIVQLYLMCFSDIIYSDGEVMKKDTKSRKWLRLYICTGDANPISSESWRFYRHTKDTHHK